MEERIFNYNKLKEAQNITNKMLGENFILIRHESKNKKLFFKKIYFPTQEEKT